MRDAAKSFLSVDYAQLELRVLKRLIGLQKQHMSFIDWCSCLGSSWLPKGARIFKPIYQDHFTTHQTWLEIAEYRYPSEPRKEEET